MRYNIAQRMNILFIAAIIFFISAENCFAQKSADTLLHVIKSLDAYHQTVKNDGNEEMINVQKLIPNIVLDLRYGHE